MDAVRTAAPTMMFLMPLYFTIKSLPEVRLLEPEQRSQLKFNRWHAFRMWAWPVFSAWLIIGLGRMLVELGDSIAFVIGCALYFVGPAYGFVLRARFIRTVRRDIRREIDAAQQAGIRVCCLECGYDLQRTEGNTCPECGAAIVREEADVKA
jgi:predicted RNA-binding Zn-ribbon protein involved in translation (DUF1610 family)